MKILGRILRIFCWVLGFLATLYAFAYAYNHPTDRVGIYIRFPLVMAAIYTLPFRSWDWRKRKVFFADNLAAFKEFGQQWSQTLKTNYYVSYHSEKEDRQKASPESILAAVLLNDVLKKDLADDEPSVRIKSRKWGKGLEVIVRCTWYRKYVFYWIPENEKAVFENLRFSKVLELEENWFLKV